MFWGSFKNMFISLLLFFSRKKLQRNLAANFTTFSVTRRFFLENKKLQDSGLEIDVISASGPWEETEKMATFRPFTRFIQSSMDQIKMDHSEVRYFIHGKIGPKSHPKHIQIILALPDPFFSSRIRMFRTSQIKKVISTNFRATDLIKQAEWM